ncbi:MAG TPA: hypothetical protein VNM72_06525 [Blastocatellia bacterium]|nr:hypothetical protein [Blastocatellia bacterium]
MLMEIADVTPCIVAGARGDRSHRQEAKDKVNAVNEKSLPEQSEDLPGEKIIGRA